MLRGGRPLRYRSEFGAWREAILVDIEDEAGRARVRQSVVACQDRSKVHPVAPVEKCTPGGAG